MTKSFLFLLLVGAVGCAAPFDPAEDCFYGKTTIHLQAQGDCAFFETEVDDAAQAIRANHFGTEDEIQHVLDREIWVRDVDSFECDNKQVLGCETEPDGNIQLIRDGSPMLHEMLHALNKIQGASNSANEAHAGWGEKGALPGVETLTIGDHTEAVGSWYNVSDNGMTSWHNIWTEHLDWRSLPLPITTASINLNSKESHGQEDLAAQPL
jgi:hypothetical protein